MLGPGGVGGFVAAALARAGEDVVVVAREATAALSETRSDGLAAARSGGLHAPARGVVTELTDPVDVLLVATKADGPGRGA